MNLFDEISALINLKTEGDYWDFKEFWHDNKASLLHDIICMANNLANRDAYIIIGVSDSKSHDGVKIKGVVEENRKDQQHLIDFLKGKKFIGGIRPVVYLQTLMLENDDGEAKPVDVIIIKNTLNTPYYLTENLRDKDKELRAGYIYTRIGDTNTAIDSFADIDKIEYLWRKRFGIDLTANKKLLLLLDSPDEWVGDLNNGDCKYHSFYPEYQIHITDIDDQSQFQNNSIMRNIADHQCDTHFSVSEIIIKYHSTILFKEFVLYLDGYRHLIPFPKTDTVYLDRRLKLNKSLTYCFFEADTIHGKLFNCLSCTEKNWYNEKWDLRPGVGFLVFANESERLLFNDYVEENLPKIMKDYNGALKQKNYIQVPETDEFYIFGWSKANEIKAWQLYEQYKGILGSSLIDKLPESPLKGSEE